MNPAELLYYLGRRVTVKRINGESRPVLAVSSPEEPDRRAEALRQWGQNPYSPRHQELETINEPLPVRVQTILSHELSVHETEQLQVPEAYPRQPDVTGSPRIGVKLRF
ncbi:hypothetical protein [Andreprevotia chitinilytica]|uniref:hypothetical protein n=1 Tax=Andreprevotia chitinilytica TaxID=396808 RepID=UPI000558D889|nr:hypothetical protein [Andreprevotia chitinilytica]